MSSDRAAVQQELEKALEQAVKDGKVPQAIVHATNRDGSFQYSFATGHQHLGHDNDTPIKTTSSLMLASQTKLLTAIVALQAVERGVLSLDDDVTLHIPEISQFGIIRGFKDSGNDAVDEPILETRKNPLTLRQLLSHSSGASYALTPEMQRFLKTRSSAAPEALNVTPTVLERCALPLAYEPGESWRYSSGLDWTGLLLQRLTGHDLEALFRTGIREPLGLTEAELTFWPEKASQGSSGSQGTMTSLSVRGPDGNLGPWPAGTPTINTGSTEPFGGHGASAQLSAYLRILRSLLAEDGVLLSPSTAELLFKPTLGDASRAALQNFMHAFHPHIPGEFDPAVPVDYSLGGLVLLEADAANGRRKTGTVLWGGMFNAFWSIDREAGLAWTFGTLMLPTGDPGTKEVCGVAERAVYRMAGVEF